MTCSVHAVDTCDLRSELERDPRLAGLPEHDAIVDRVVEIVAGFPFSKLAAHIAELEQLIRDADHVARLRGDRYGLCDAVDNYGNAYPSAWAGKILNEVGLLHPSELTDRAIERHAAKPYPPPSPNSRS